MLIETSSNLGTGIGAELLGDYHEAVKLLTLAIEEERDAMKLALAHRFRGLAYKHLGRRDEALRDFLEVVRLQPQLDLGYYNAGVSRDRQLRRSRALSGKSHGPFIPRRSVAPQVSSAFATISRQATCSSGN